MLPPTPKPVSPEARRALSFALALALSAVLPACGSKEEEDPAPTGNECAVPRQGIDPFTGRPYADVQGTVADEKAWLRGWTDYLYLWYSEVPKVIAANYATPIEYFKVLKTPKFTASGQPKDRFHFAMPTEDFMALSQSGVQAGYGVEWVILSGTPPREVVAAFTQPNSPGAAANIGRGARLLKVDGVDVASGSDVDTLNEGLSPSAADRSHTFVVKDLDGTTRTVTLTSANVQHAPVHTRKVLTTPNGAVGYLLFNDHLATAESALAGAIQELKDAAITDLVLDLRYNGGGLLDVASELAFMIAGPSRTSGKTFEETRFNDKHRTTNPVTKEPLAPMPFHDLAQGFSATKGVALPTLDLGRVYVLTGARTCSASESIINGLRGVDVEVVLIGQTTCGKPYGFYPFDHCGTTYFSIQLEGVNAKGFGDYADGFVPAGAGGAGVPGCVVADDFEHDLGDTNESLLSAALSYRASGTCPAAVSSLVSSQNALTEGDPAQRISVPFWREIRRYRP